MNADAVRRMLEAPRRYSETARMVQALNHAIDPPRPRPTVRVLIIIGVLLGVLAGYTEFALMPAEAQAVSSAPLEGVLQSLGTIGVIAGNAPHEATLTPRTPAAEAARAAAAEGAADTFWMFLELCRGTGLKGLVACVPVMAVLGGVFAPVGAAVKATIGAIRADPPAAVEAAPGLILRRFTESDVPGALRDRVTDLGNDWTRRRDWRFLVLAGDDSQGQALDSGTLEERGIDTVLRVDVERIGLAGAQSQINPSLALVMTVRVRLLRVPGMDGLHETSLTWESRPRRFGEWVADDGNRLREEIGRATDDLAARIVGEVFLLFPPLDGVSSADERLVRERMTFLQAGLTTDQEILDRLGNPARRYDAGRVLTYLMYTDRRGQFRSSPPSDDTPARYRLILVFGRDHRLEAHRLVLLEKP